MGKNLRICEVNGRIGYFHMWEWYADIIPGGYTVCSRPGGQISYVVGIVEFPEGIERVKPEDIHFRDETHCCIVLENENYQKRMEAENEQHE